METKDALIAGTIGALTGSLFSRSTRASAQEPGQVYVAESYIITTDIHNTYAMNGISGNVDFQNINATSVIRYALDNLTQNRTWKEKVYIKGDYKLNDTIKIPSYTELEIYGKLSLQNNINKNMITNSDYINGNTNISIKNGFLDGNKTNQTDTTPGNDDCIHFRNTSDYTIENLTCQNAKLDNISTWNSPNGFINNCIFDGADRAGLQIQGSIPGLPLPEKNISVTSCIARNNGTDGFTLGHSYDTIFNSCHSYNNGQHGFAGDRADDIIIESCISKNNSGFGFQVADAGGLGSNPPEKWQLNNCKAYQNIGHGFSIANLGFDIQLSNCMALENGNSINLYDGFIFGRNVHHITLTNCHSIKNSRRGYNLEYPRDITMSNCLAKNNGQFASNSDGIFGIGDATYNLTNITLIGCISTDDQTTKTQRYGINIGGTEHHNIIIGCNLRNNVSTGLVGTTDPTDIKRDNQE